MEGIKRKTAIRRKYLAIALYKDGVTRSFSVHRLVCETFHGPPPTEHHQVRHLDGNKLNNAAANLAWGTPKENQADRKTHGTYLRGAEHPMSKITEETAKKKIIVQLGGGETPPAIAARLDVSESAVYMIYYGRTWTHLTGGKLDIPLISGPAKIKKTQVADIRAALARGENLQDLADLYGVTRGSIQNIKSGRTWKKV